MQDLEKTLEKLGAYIRDELCCHRDVGGKSGGLCHARNL